MTRERNSASTRLQVEDKPLYFRTLPSLRQFLVAQVAAAMMAS